MTFLAIESATTILIADEATIYESASDINYLYIYICIVIHFGWQTGLG